MSYSIFEATSFAAIYQRLDSYLNLIEADRLFFDKLFPMLLFNDNDIYSDKYLSNRFKNDLGKPMSISTLQKRLKRLSDANLIVKKEDRECIDGKWTTTARHINLDPATFSFMKAKTSEERIDKARQEAYDNQSLIPKKENESYEEHAIRTGKLEASSIEEESFEAFFFKNYN